MKNIQQLSSAQIERVSRIRNSLTELGAAGFLDRVDDNAWRILSEFKGFPAWLAFAMPEPGFYIEKFGEKHTIFLWINSLHDFFSLMENAEYTVYFKASYYPIGVTLSGALLAVEAASSKKGGDDFTIVSLSWEARNYFKKREMSEIAYHLKEDFQGFLDLYNKSPVEAIKVYQDGWEWFIGDKKMSLDDLLE